MSQVALSNQQRLIESLLDPGCYPHPVKTVRLIETHISWVLLAGRYAYKIKKALDLGFLDATRLDARHDYCSEEIRLNRRLAPQLYLGVATIGGSHANPEWDTHPAIEYAVKMRRFASTKTLDHLIIRGKIDSANMDNLANTLAQFHSALPATETTTSAEFSANIHNVLLQNFSQLSGSLTEAADLSKLSALQQASELAYSANRQRLEQRCAQGFVRECHGDLHLGNIVLIGNKPTPFDGIDFNPALRWIDVMDEVAFLFMDLLHHQRKNLAYRFLNSYLELTGDFAGVGLLNFYCAYRATVRTKVSAIRSNQTSTSPRAQREALSTCRNYLALATEQLERRQPRLLITHGLPGSGKSIFAQAALERFGAIRLRSDVERKRLFGISPLENSHTKQNIYSAEATQCTYAHLLAIARLLLTAGHTVIVDAAFPKHDEREMFLKLAQEMRVPFAIASLQADEATLRTRILKRQHLSNDPSEADIEVLRKVQNLQDPLSTQEKICSAIFFATKDNSYSESTWKALEELFRII